MADRKIPDGFKTKLPLPAWHKDLRVTQEDLDEYCRDHPPQTLRQMPPITVTAVWDPARIDLTQEQLEGLVADGLLLRRVLEILNRRWWSWKRHPGNLKYYVPMRVKGLDTILAMEKEGYVHYHDDPFMAIIVGDEWLAERERREASDG